MDPTDYFSRAARRVGERASAIEYRRGRPGSARTFICLCCPCAYAFAGGSIMTATTIFRARTIHTMNPSRPRGQAVAVRDGRVLGVGTVDELLEWGEAAIDDRFRDRVLLPGFVEAHSHSAKGALWGFSYVGYFDRNDPSGKTWKATRSIDDLVDRLREA